MHFYNDIDVWELYDLEKDPNETNNIYGQPGTEKLTQELLTELIRLEKQYQDEVALKLTLPVAQAAGVAQ